MEKILFYFKSLPPEQQAQLAALEEVYRAWNAKINVVSRKDMDNLYLHHVLHSLAIAKLFRFAKGSLIVDLGTGGGFPGIPLAILHPDTEFLLSDSINKKLIVAQEVANTLNLKNVKTIHARTETLKVKADFVVTRGVAPLKDLVQWSRTLIKTKHINSIPNGLLALKGGKLNPEIKELGNDREATDIFPIKDFFKEEFFKEKAIVYVPL